MSKYSKYDHRQVKARQWRIHPIWRGIGCFLVILVPILSYLIAAQIILSNETAHYFVVPPELAKELNYSLITRYLPSLKSFTDTLPHPQLLVLALTVAVMVICFAVLSIIYSFLYSMVGPSRLGPLDAPPVRGSPRTRSH